MIPPWFDRSAKESWLAERQRAAAEGGWTLRCPWCDLRLPETARPRCDRCSGAVPTCSDAPPTPRRLPSISWLLRSRKVWPFAAAPALLLLLLVSAGALFPRAAWIVWPLAGLPAIYGLILTRGLRRSSRRRLLARGAPIVGEIDLVTPNIGQRWDDKAPWMVHYLFTVDGVRQRGSFATWNTVDVVRPAGSPLWILYDPDRPTDHTPWPPPTGWPFAVT